MKPTIELPINELKTAVAGFGKIIRRNTTLPVLGHIRVQRDASGVVTLQATDLESTAIYQAVERCNGPACDFLVPFDPLIKLVKGSKESFSLIAASKERTTLRSLINGQPLEQTVETLPVSEFPPLPQINGKSMPVDGVFRDRLREALACCSEDSSRYVIQHACLDTRPTDGHYIAASNGRHLYCANSFAFDLKDPVLIPDRDFLHWNKFMEDGQGNLSVKPKHKDEPSWIQMRSGAWTFLTRTCDEQFPNWKQVVPSADRLKTTIELDRNAVVTLLAGVPHLPGGDESNSPVTIEATSNGLIVRAKARDAKEWTRLAVDGSTISGKAVSISLNRDYLVKALKFGLHTVEIEDALSPLLFREGGRRMVVMPLRPDDVPAATQSPSTSTTPPVNNQPPAQPKEEAAMPKPPETKPAAETSTATTETSPVKGLIQHIDQIKDTLKGVLRDLGAVMDDLKQFEKDRKASEKEIEAVRAKLREIQQVRI